MTEDFKGTSARGFSGLVPGARRIRYGGAMLDEREIEAVNRVMRTGMIIGDQVQTFEKRVAALLGHQYGVMVNSGCSALMLAMRMLGCAQGVGGDHPGADLLDRCRLDRPCRAACRPSSMSCPTPTRSISTSWKRMITPKTKAILVPNLVGGVPDWDRLRAIADTHKLILVEDSCDTLGAKLRGRPTGNPRRYHRHQLFDLPHHHLPGQWRAGRGR